MGKQKPEIQPDPWHLCSLNCPRCLTPLRVRGTQNLRKLTHLLCVRCEWKLNLEHLRRSVQLSLGIDEDAEEAGDD